MEIDGIKRHTIGYTTNKKKNIKNYLVNTLEPRFKRKFIKVIGITCLYDPEDLSLDEAWKKVVDDVMKIHEALNNLNDTSFSLSTIEIHEGTKEKIQRKSKTKQDMNTKEIYSETVRRVIRDKIHRDSMEDKLISQGKNQREILIELREYDEQNGFLVTQKVDENGRALLLCADNWYPIVWNSELDPKNEDVFADYRTLHKLRKKTEISISDKKKIEGLCDGYFLEKKISHEKVGLSLLGYPHLHFAVGCFNIKGVYRNTREYGELISKIISDTQVGSNRNARDKSGTKYDEIDNTISYVLKNARHKPVYDKLLKLKKENLQIILNIARDEDNEISSCFDFFSTTKCPITKTLFRMNSEKNETKINAEPIHTIKNVNNAYSKACATLGSIMEKQDVKICNHKMYQKMEGSKNSWEVMNNGDRTEGSISEFVFANMFYDNNYIRKFTPDFEQLVNANKQNLLPSMELTTEWVEFGDFSVFLPKGIICDEVKYPCFKYFPEITKSMLLKDEDIYPKLFMEIIDNSFPIKEAGKKRKKLLDSLYKLFLPKLHKDKCIYAVGEASSGKSTMIDSVAHIMPRNLRIILAESTFSLSCVVGKMIIILDENGGIKSLTDAQLLGIMEGAKIAINKKFEDPFDYNFHGHTVFCGNENTFATPKYSGVYMMPTKPNKYDENGNEIPLELYLRLLKFYKENKIEFYKYSSAAKYYVRFREYNFRNLPHSEIGMKKKVIKEGSKILLYLMKNYFGEFKMNLKNEEIDKIYNKWRKERKEEDNYY